ncbi:MAG: hypothetical protein AAGE86_06595 [Pseudomonadota bacterium]
MSDPFLEGLKSSQMAKEQQEAEEAEMLAEADSLFRRAVSHCVSKFNELGYSIVAERNPFRRDRYSPWIRVEYLNEFDSYGDKVGSGNKAILLSISVIRGGRLRVGGTYNTGVPREVELKLDPDVSRYDSLLRVLGEFLGHHQELGLAMMRNNRRKA